MSDAENVFGDGSGSRLEGAAATHSRSRRGRAIVILAAAAACLAITACGSSSSKSSSSSSGSSSTSSSSGTSAAKAGGSLTVLLNSGYEGAWPTGLDPATNTNGAANQDLMNSIYGNLFELGAGGTIINDLASSYTFADGGKTLTIDIRPGVKFTDGTPFNAAAVAANIKRDLASPCTCSPKGAGWPLAPTNPITTTATTVSLHYTVPFAPAVHDFIDSNVNWIASPTALAKLGEQKFKITPVGAGPFTVVSNTLSSQLVLKKNPNYWQAGHPLLDNLTFKSIGGDEAAYEAMQAGQAGAYVDMSTPAIINEAKSHFTVTQQLSTSPYDLQLNTKIPPFNNKLAREAIYYATNFSLISQHIFDNKFPLTQSFTGAGGLFYDPTVPGYPAYNLAKAKALVKQLGGLNINLGTISVLVATETTEALQSEWAQAGIKATIHSYQLAPLIAQFESGKWQSFVQTAGSWDPASGVGVYFRFGSKSPFSGVHDPKLDSLILAAASTLNNSQRAALYSKAAQYIAANDYGPFYFSWAPSQVAAKSVSGPGLTTPLPAVVVSANVLWEDVSDSG
jgi:peptide/nickel transport system substrate-binding protein